MLLIMNNAMQGILSSFFFKYADTILKKYSSTMATIFTGLMSALLFGHALTLNFLIGVTIVFISMHIFFSQGQLSALLPDSNIRVWPNALQLIFTMPHPSASSLRLLVASACTSTVTKPKICISTAWPPHVFKLFCKHALHCVLITRLHTLNLASSG